MDLGRAESVADAPLGDGRAAGVDVRVVGLEFRELARQAELAPPQFRPVRDDLRLELGTLGRGDLAAVRGEDLHA